MTVTALFASLALALQAAPSAPATAPDASLALEDLGIEQAAALRCAVGLALVSGWQAQGDGRGADFPEVGEEGAREFFVRTMARLMDERELDRPGVRQLVALQQADLEAQPGTIGEIMPACLLMKRSAGL